MIEQALYQQLCGDVLPVFRSMSKDGRYAITLGGSHGKGLSDRSSDFDFRVYYEQPADAPQWDAAFADLNRFVEKWKALDVEIDGVWARSIQEVECQLDTWISGKASPVPMFWNVWGYHFLTDIYNQAIVEDPCGIAQGWKDRLIVYPDALRISILDRCSFSLKYWSDDYHYRNKVIRRDPVFCASIASRLINDIMQVIYALNRFYFPGDGMNLHYSRSFSIKPENLEKRVSEILYPGNGPEYLERQYHSLIRLIDDLLSLPEMSARHQ